MPVRHGWPHHPGASAMKPTRTDSHPVLESLLRHAVAIGAAIVGAVCRQRAASAPRSAGCRCGWWSMPAVRVVGAAPLPPARRANADEARACPATRVARAGRRRRRRRARRPAGGPPRDSPAARLNGRTSGTAPRWTSSARQPSSCPAPAFRVHSNRAPERRCRSCRHACQDPVDLAHGLAAASVAAAARRQGDPRRVRRRFHRSLRLA